MLPSLFFTIIWFLSLIGGIVGFVILVIAAWRGMQAHESLARSHAAIAATLQQILQAQQNTAKSAKQKE
jgi:hypothetical protein